MTFNLFDAIEGERHYQRISSFIVPAIHLNGNPLPEFWNGTDPQEPGEETWDYHAPWDDDSINPRDPDDPYLDNPHDGGKDWWHATAQDFKQFRVNPPGRNFNKEYNTGLGPHFTASIDTAKNIKNYLDRGRIIQAGLKLQNPRYYASEAGMAHHALSLAVQKGLAPPNSIERVHDLNRYNMGGGREMNEQGSRSRRNLASTYNQWINDQGAGPITQNFKKHLAKAGHDGIVYENDYEMPFSQAAISFHPTKQVSIKNHNYHLGTTMSTREQQPTNTCSKCNGSAQVWHEGDCSHCGGTGQEPTKK